MALHPLKQEVGSLLRHNCGWLWGPLSPQPYLRSVKARSVKTYPSPFCKWQKTSRLGSGKTDPKEKAWRHCLGDSLKKMTTLLPDHSEQNFYMKTLSVYLQLPISCQGHSLNCKPQPGVTNIGKPPLHERDLGQSKHKKPTPSKQRQYREQKKTKRWSLDILRKRTFASMRKIMCYFYFS